MERKHKERILQKFGSEIEDRPIIILDIPDEYQFMDPDLIVEIESKVKLYLEE